MAWFLFLDESGQDGRNSPYEVLAGLAIEDRQLWRLIQAIKGAQEAHFGLRLFDAYGAEAKGLKLLNRKTFRLAGQKEAMPPADRARLAHAALTDGANVRGDQLTALGQAKLAYVRTVLNLCRQHGAVAFASIIPNDIVRPTTGVRPMNKPKRDELDPFAQQVTRLRYHAATPGGHDTWGFVVLGELRVENVEP